MLERRGFTSLLSEDLAPVPSRPVRYTRGHWVIFSFSQFSTTDVHVTKSICRIMYIKDYNSIQFMVTEQAVIAVMGTPSSYQLGCLSRTDG